MKSKLYKNFKHIKHINPSALLGCASLAPRLASLPIQMAKSAEKDIPIHTKEAWDEEEIDILERANWLCKKIITDPDTLINSMPPFLTRKYKGEWAIYCCSMLTHSLANISVIYPHKKTPVLGLMERLIDIVNTPTIRYYDTLMWKEDALESLSGKKSHMTYLSILAWMISNYKLSGGGAQFDTLFDVCCETLNRRMHESKYELNLLSYPNLPIFFPDMLVTLIALRNYARLNGGKYQNTVNQWLHNAKTKWIHKPTGLLLSTLPGASRNQRSRPIKGSHVALNCSYLALVDEEFAWDQHNRMKQYMSKTIHTFGTYAFGIKEYVNKSPKFSFAAGDAGIVFKGVSGSGTAFALGSGTYFEDWEFRSQLLRTAELAGGTKYEKGKRHYRLGDLFITGEATALAMRTQIKR